MGSLKRQIVALIAVCLLACGGVRAGVIESVHRGAGTTAFGDVLTVGYDAVSLGMGRVHVAVPNDVFGVVGNPAALARIETMQAMISYHSILIGLDIRAGAASFVRPIRTAGVFGVTMDWLSFGEIDLVDEQNRSLGGVATPHSLAGSISWARKIGATPLLVGASLKWLYDVLDYEGETADAIALDIGAQYGLMGSSVVLGVLAKNMGFQRSGYSEDTENAPLPASFGAGIFLNPRALPLLRLAFELDKPIDDYLHYRLGAELAPFSEYFFVRTGVDITHRDLREGLRTLTGSQDEDYQKTNWYALGLGLGVVAPLKEMSIRMDTAVHLKVSNLPPGWSMNVSTEF